MVIYNAGAGGDFDTLIDVHLRGSNRISEAAWPHWVASGAGRVINISSTGSYGCPACPVTRLKAGILSLTRTQALPLQGAPHGVRANAILLGA